MLGEMDTRDALAKAQEEGLDLVEVNAKSKPPICKIIDYGKYKYDQARKARESKKNRKSQELKEIKLRPAIGDHDFNVKLKRTREFLEAGHRVKLVVQFRGRQMAHPETGKAVLDRMCKELAGIVSIISMSKMEGRFMSMLIGPNAKTAQKSA